MKRLLLLATFLMGNTSAVNLSAVVAKDVCIAEEITVIKTSPSGSVEYATPEQPLKLIPTLLDMGFTVDEEDDCQYRLSNVVTYEYSEYFKDYYLKSNVFLVDHITKNNPYGYSTGYLAAIEGNYKDRASFDSEIRKIVESGYQQFILDWKASHK